MTNLGHCANELMPQIMPACKAVTDRRYRRTCFNAAQYGSAVRCRARHASPRLVKKVPSGLFSPSCFPNCKIKFCSMILQFCRCGGLFDAKGHPDGFLSHFPSLRNFRLSRFFDSLKGMQPHPLYLSSFPQDVRQCVQSPQQPQQPRWCSMCQSDTASHAASSASTTHSSQPMRQAISSRS